MEIRRTFRVTPAAPSMARRSLASLASTLVQDRLDDLRLIVTELITNCVRHSGLGAQDRIQMRVAVAEERIRVEVTDPGRGFTWPPEREPGKDGRGLAIVDRLASRWGRRNGSQNTVWAELPVS